MAWDDNLDPATPAFQIASSLNDRIRVVAGPGTGKSFAMKRRVGRLLEGGTDPRKILALTFTRVAAEDLHRELVSMRVAGCDQMEGVTLHSLSFRILSRNHVLQATGRTPRPLNDFELKPLLADLASDHDGVRGVRKRIKAYEAAWARLQHEEPGHVRSAEDQAFITDLVPWLQFHKAMLIGEVIPHLYEYLRNNPTAEERAEYTHIVVDEYQDLNKAEQRVIDLLADAAEVCIVGDDDQSIYRFKHAHPDGIREWIQNTPTADDIALDECRRCPTTVTDIASHLIQFNTNRPVPRTLSRRVENGAGDVRITQYPTLAAEVSGVATTIAQMVKSGTPPGDILVLAQRNVIGTPIYEKLIELGVPVKSYYAEAELDQVGTQRRFALLKLLVDRGDRVALRWLLGLGSQSWFSRAYRRLRDYCEENNVTPWEALEQIQSGRIAIPHVNSLKRRFDEITAELRELEECADLRSVIDRVFPEGDESVRDLRALSLQILDELDNDERTEFLRELSNAITKPEIPLEIEDVRIMSLHKSKGLSSAITFVCGCVQGLLPRLAHQHASSSERQATLEEQRRLFYVGITRVKAIPDEGKVGTLLLTYSRTIPIASARSAGIEPADVRHGVALLNASQFIMELGPTAPPAKSG